MTWHIFKPVICGLIKFSFQSTNLLSFCKLKYTNFCNWERCGCVTNTEYRDR